MVVADGGGVGSGRCRRDDAAGGRAAVRACEGAGDVSERGGDGYPVTAPAWRAYPFRACLPESNPARPCLARASRIVRTGRGRNANLRSVDLPVYLDGSWWRIQRAACAAAGATRTGGAGPRKGTSDGCGCRLGGTLGDSRGKAAAYTEAMRSGDAASALEVARKPLPATWPVDVRREWSARRSIARMAAGAVSEGGIG